MSCPQCFTGHVNPGTPTGRWDTVHGLRTYIAEPAAGEQTRGIIVIIPDAFGVNFVNNQILADHYASATQYLVYLPDFMEGKAASVQCMINMAHMWDEKESWFMKPALREDKGATLPVGVAGFCWGGLYAIKLTHDTTDAKTAGGRPLADAFFVAHPSNLTIPQDIADVKGNLSIAIGDDDGVMGIKQFRAAQNILADKKDLDSELVIYPGAKHGFSIRASRAQPDSKQTKQAEEAEKQATSWFQRHFEGAKRLQVPPKH
ncbi:carboxymethylenebutenolidase, partial [Lecanoromycetidae sp. Uapishka_2]